MLKLCCFRLFSLSKLSTVYVYMDICVYIPLQDRRAASEPEDRETPPAACGLRPAAGCRPPPPPAPHHRWTCCPGAAAAAGSVTIAGPSTCWRTTVTVVITHHSSPITHRCNVLVVLIAAAAIYSIASRVRICASHPASSTALASPGGCLWRCGVSFSPHSIDLR